MKGRAKMRGKDRNGRRGTSSMFGINRIREIYVLFVKSLSLSLSLLDFYHIVAIDALRNDEMHVSISFCASTNL